MKKVYISGPYSAEQEYDLIHNISRARKEAAYWWILGAAVFCPHLNSAFMGGLLPKEQFLSADLDFLRMCDIAVFLPGFRLSEGAAQEHRVARQEGLALVYCTPVGGYQDKDKNHLSISDLRALICPSSDGASSS